MELDSFLHAFPLGRTPECFTSRLPRFVMQITNDTERGRRGTNANTPPGFHRRPAERQGGGKGVDPRVTRGNPCEATSHGQRCARRRRRSTPHLPPQQVLALVRALGAPRQLERPGHQPRPSRDAQAPQQRSADDIDAAPAQGGRVRALDLLHGRQASRDGVG